MKFVNFPFVCPVCGNKLTITGKNYVCSSGHTFDIAKQGYVNLLMKNSSGGHHGDDKLMVSSRRKFLDKGYYKALAEAVVSFIGNNRFILDAGCGEGYYTSLFSDNNYVCGIDISKDAVKAAAGKCKNADFAVASVFDIPAKDNSFDTIINIFAPDSNAEYLRTLTRNGRLITVIPMERHLEELKKAVYDKIYLNPSVTTTREGFTLTRSEIIKYEIELKSNEDIKSLFMMTPYFYKTGKHDQEKLEDLDYLKTKIEFFLAEYKKD